MKKGLLGKVLPHVLTGAICMMTSYIYTKHRYSALKNKLDDDDIEILKAVKDALESHSGKIESLERKVTFFQNCRGINIPRHESKPKSNFSEGKSEDEGPNPLNMSQPSVSRSKDFRIVNE